MSDLIVVAYTDEFRAAEVLSTLRRLQSESLIELDDAVLVTRDSKGHVKIHQSFNLTAMGAAQGGFWGTLIGLLFLNPLLGGLTGAAFGALSGRLSDYGIDDHFIKELASHLQAGSSAIFLLVRKVTPDKVVPEISKFGGKVLKTTLSKEADLRLQAALDAGGTAAAPAAI